MEVLGGVMVKLFEKFPLKAQVPGSSTTRDWARADTVAYSTEQSHGGMEMPSLHSAVWGQLLQCFISNLLDQKHWILLLHPLSINTSTGYQGQTGRHPTWPETNSLRSMPWTSRKS
jgi:hypothetical protein